MDKSVLNQFIPKRLPQIETAHIKTRWGSEYYVLHNPNANGYLRVDPENYYIWELMDGKRNIMDIVIEYHNRFNAYPLDRINNLIRQLYTNSLIEGHDKKPAEDKKHGFEHKLTRLANSAFQKEYAFKNADKVLDGIYPYFGRFFFMRLPLIFFGLISLIGFGLFIYWEPDPLFQFLDLRGDYDFGLLVLLISYPFMIFFHELAHAMACKHYGRKVRKAGLMFYFGMPAFFVDSTDMWLEEKSFARVVVSFAGPAFNILLGGFLCLIVAFIPENDFSLGLYQVAYLSFFFALLNLNPLLEYDGYYILMEWLEIPDLRKRSFNFIFNKLTGKGKEDIGFHREHKIYIIYGILSIIFTFLLICAVLYIWKNELRKMVFSIFTDDGLMAEVLLGGITLVAGFFMAVGLTARGILWLKKLTIKKQ